MSLHGASWRMGEALGTGIGGLTLLLFDYNGLGLALGAMSFIAALVFYFGANEPTHN